MTQPIVTVMLVNSEAKVDKNTLAVNVQDYPTPQDAIDSVASAGGTVYFPPGTYTLTSALVLKPNVVLRGSGRSATILTCASSGIFTWTATLSNVQVEHMKLVSNGGHVFTNSSGDHGIYNANIRHCVILQNDPDSSIVYHHSALDYDNVVFEDCDMMRSGSATVPAFDIVNSGGAANENRWVRCWARSNNCTSSPFFWLESSSTGNYAYGNRFEDITGEQNPGGLIRALSTLNLIIENVNDYDASTAYVADVIYVGKSAVGGGLRSRFPVVRNCGRRGGTLSGGVYDINMPTSATVYALIVHPNHSSSGLKINISANASDGTTLINGLIGSVTGPTLASQVSSYYGLPVAFGGGLYIGASFISSGIGSPETHVVGSPGDMFLRTDGGAGTSLYIKETGSATNTGWVAK